MKMKQTRFQYTLEVRATYNEQLNPEKVQAIIAEHIINAYAESELSIPVSLGVITIKAK